MEISFQHQVVFLLVSSGSDQAAGVLRKQAARQRFLSIVLNAGQKGVSMPVSGGHESWIHVANRS